jgi:hypothetical protein
MYKNIGEIAFQDLLKKESLRHSGSIFFERGSQQWREGRKS